MSEGTGGGSAGGGGGIAHPPPQVDQQNLIESFCGITSSTPAEAIFFLESHSWQLDAALQSFFDAADDDDTARSLPPAVAAAASHPAAPASRRRRRRQLQEEEEDDEDDEEYVPPAADESTRQHPPTRSTVAAMASSSGSGRSSKPSRASGGRPPGGIRTLADLNRRSGRGSGSDTDDDSDGPQEYYTGGEKSGMLVQDPSKGNTDVDAIFEQARQMGTAQESIDHLRPSSSSKSFTGTGRLLTGETVEASPEPPESVIHEVVFWINGFTVNDGPLRRFDDPENAAFLESIKRSECPKELAPADRRTAVHVSLSRRDEKCPEPVKRFNPFGGVGRTLGAGSSTSSASPEAAAPASASAGPTGAPSSAAGLHVDDSLPSTSIQLRLADGTRMVARFNNFHTVGDIRGFIDASRPGSTRSYQLQTVGFPPKQLTDVTQTIEQAGLANSVVIQKL